MKLYFPVQGSSSSQGSQIDFKSYLFNLSFDIPWAENVQFYFNNQWLRLTPCFTRFTLYLGLIYSTPHWVLSKETTFHLESYVLRKV